MKEKYTINDILDYAIKEWKINEYDSDSKQAYKKAIVRQLKKAKIHPLDDKRGKSNLYAIDNLNNFVTEQMGTYFKEFSSLDTKDIITSSSIDENELAKISDEENAIFEQQLEGTYHQEQPSPVDEANERIENNLNELKYKIMIEALFNEKFELRKDKLRADLETVELFETFDDNRFIDKEVLSAKKRLENLSNYYIKKK
ncbi:hypothetical protein [Pediococcus acidilactici]|uniref:hypothetical protein n=1 Tax=Pediococcus acidilactici TaxID=1254 RepID=UPI00137C1C8A|nr:hypothetical protein [Pediococcus acidilactici]QHS02492.1 hypothetical protein GWA24_01490 [Pediococcus acidilactici]